MQRMGRERHRVFVKSGVTADTTEELLQRHFSSFGTVTDVYIPRSVPGPTPKGFAYISFETDDAVQKAVKEAVHEIEGKHYPVGKAEPRPAERTTWHHQEKSTMQVAEPLLPLPQRYSRSISPRGGLLPNPYNGGPTRLELRPSFVHSPRIPLATGGPLREMPSYASRPLIPSTDSFGLDGRMGISARMPLDVLPSEQISRSPRVFVGGLPDALVERHVRAHFQTFGTVEDVYFPRERHTGKRRGFCFVRFSTTRAAYFAATQSPRVILGYEVGEIKVANERADDFGNEGPVEVGLGVDRLGYGPERGYDLERGNVLERSYGPVRGHGPAERGYFPDLGFRPERAIGYKIATPYHDLGRDLPRELPHVDFARDFPRELPRELAGQLTRELPRDFARDLPNLARPYDSRPPPPIRYRPY